MRTLFIFNYLIYIIVSNHLSLINAIFIDEIFNGTVAGNFEKTYLVTNVSTDLSCQGKCMYTKNSLCFCDASCEMFGDCCYDYWKLCKESASHQTVSLETLKTMSTLTKHTDMMHNSTVKLIDSFVYKGELVYAVFNAKQVNSCDPVNSAIKDYEIYKSLCLPTSYSNDVDQNRTLLAYYDKTTYVIYKNYYCGKCNGIADDGLTQMPLVVDCEDPEFDFNFNSTNKWTLKSLAESCQIKYLKKSYYNNFRKTSQVRNSWLTCNKAASNETMNLLKRIFNETSSTTTLSPISQYSSPLCDVYNSPVVLKVTQNYDQADSNETQIYFKNLHCLQCWMEMSNLSLNLFSNSQIKNLTSTDASGVKFMVSLGFLDSKYFDNSVAQLIQILPLVAENRNFNDFILKYGEIEKARETLELDEVQYAVKTGSKILKLVNNKYRLTTISSPAYLNSLIEESVDAAAAVGAVSSYDFIFQIDLTLDNNLSGSNQIPPTRIGYEFYTNNDTTLQLE